MLMRPYMINQTMTKSTSDSLGISDLMETSTTNLSMFDKRRRYLVRDSMDFRDKNGKKVIYAPASDDGKAYRRSMGKWVLGCRNLLVNRWGMEGLSEAESVAIARGYFCLLVLRNWQKVAAKHARFRKIISRFFCSQSLKHWVEVTRLLRLADKFCGAIFRAFYRKAFSKMNANRLATKAAQIMNLRSGNSKKVLFHAWRMYMGVEMLEKKRCDQFANYQLKKKCIKRWRYEVKIKHVFMKAVGRIKVSKIAPAFDRWRMMSDWMAFTEKFWGTAVERAVKKSYLRMAGKRWWNKVLVRRKLRKTLSRVFRSGEIGMLSWGFERLRIPKREKVKKAWKPRKLGHCNCVYALMHGGHCKCSWELHFNKRMKNFNVLAESADDILQKARKIGRTFEEDYDQGLHVEDRESLRESWGGNGSMGATAQWDQNGRRIRRDNSRRKRRVVRKVEDIDV
ncbi:hypothetical protein TrRE_jg11387 [Triparma retinervis]|nr:hypothetical protein TrRE_jg11387 [Triparma retinervis]